MLKLSRREKDATATKYTRQESFQKSVILKRNIPSL